MALLVTNVPWPGAEGDPGPALAKRLRLKRQDIASAELLKRSVDARRRPPRWLANYRVELHVDEQAVLDRKLHGVRRFTERDEAALHLSAGGKRVILANVFTDFREDPVVTSLIGRTKINLICSPQEARDRLHRLQDLGLDDVLLITPFDDPDQLDRARELLPN